MTYSLNEVWKIENNFNFDSITNKKNIRRNHVTHLGEKIIYDSRNKIYLIEHKVIII